MPYINSCQFKDLITEIGIDEVKDYISNLLSALGHIHNLGIIRHDIEPDNFLYNRRARKLSHIDFGLAQQSVERRGAKRKLNFGEVSSSPTINMEDISCDCDCGGQLTVCDIC